MVFENFIKIPVGVERIYGGTRIEAKLTIEPKLQCTHNVPAQDDAFPFSQDQVRMARNEATQALIHGGRGIIDKTVPARCHFSSKAFTINIEKVTAVKMQMVVPIQRRKIPFAGLQLLL